MGTIGTLGIYESQISCGVCELLAVHYFDLKIFRKYIAGTTNTLGDFDGFKEGITYAFSDNNGGRAHKLAETIKKYKLGKVISTPWIKNPNSLSRIKTWLWVYNGRIPRGWNRV